MGEFAIIYRQFIRPNDSQKTVLHEYCNLMNAKDDVEDFIDNILSENGLWIMPELYSYDLLLTPDNIEDNQLHNKTVFGVSVSDLMGIQEHTHPRAKMPLVVPALCKAIRDAGGLKTANIFREVASFENRRKLKEQLNSGNYNVNVTDPHLAATVLKDWLRELPESLFPVELYDDILELASNRTLKTADAMVIFHKIPTANQNIFIQVNLLLREIWNNVVHTKMSKQTLAIVFASVLLRAPLQKQGAKVDSLRMLHKNKLENRFLYYTLSLNFKV